MKNLTFAIFLALPLLLFYFIVSTYSINVIKGIEETASKNYIQEIR